MGAKGAAAGGLVVGTPASGRSNTEGARTVHLRAAEVHQRVNWSVILERLGVGPEFLTGKHCPCPICGGKDRFRFTNFRKHGDYFCNGCEAGDGFKLLMKFHGWDFSTALERVIEAAGLEILLINKKDFEHNMPTKTTSLYIDNEVSHPTRRVLDLLRGSCAPDDAQDIVDYLTSRSLWPLPVDCALRAHAGVDYFEDRQRVGKYSALIAPIVDIDGDLVSVHVTYLENGRKLETYQPRKILSALTGRAGCAVRLMAPAGNVLGIAEGIETALSAGKLHSMPVWSALNTSLLQKFEPPPQVTTLVVFADRDTAGLEAAARLMERLQGRVKLELRVPPAPAKDWNDHAQEQTHA